MIAADVVLGAGVQVHHPELVNLYGCTIGDGCNIGAFVEIRRGVTVGRNVKIQAFAFLPEGVTVEDGAFIGPHACFTNDRWPRAVKPDMTPLDRDGWQVTPTLVRQGASIGANATIRCGVTIGRWAMVAAGAVVTRDVPDHAIVAGVPARVVGDARQRAAAPTWPSVSASSATATGDRTSRATRRNSRRRGSRRWPTRRKRGCGLPRGATPASPPIATAWR
jgi:acetyltransferase-like isoleucine patch superfamily enzyme